MSLRTVRGISFDLWDTLISYPDSRAVRSRRVNLLSRLTGKTPQVISEGFSADVSEDDAQPVDRASDLSVVGRTHRLLQRLGHNTKEIEHLATRLSSLALEHQPLVFPHVTYALEELSKVMPLAIVSNTRWTSGTTLRCLLGSEGVDLLKYFSRAVFSDEVGWAKPSKQIFEEVWRPLGIAPEDTIHVGDRISLDVIGAKNSGCKAVLCRVSRPQPEREDSQANGIFYDYAALPALLQLINGDELPGEWMLAARGQPINGNLIAGRVHRGNETPVNYPTGAILILKSPVSGEIARLKRAAAVLTESLEPGGEIVRLVRRNQIPCIAGLKAGIDSLQEGQLILLDAAQGHLFVKS